MESPPGPDRVEGDHEDSNSNSVETGTPSSIIDGEGPTISSPEAGTDFLPIKKMGVEISDERAEQLKNDVRRLSPEVVSLRERTLGEISLTPDSSFFELEEDLSQGDEGKTEDALSRLIGEPMDAESPPSPATLVKCESEVIRGQELVIPCPEGVRDDLSAGEASGSEILVVDGRTDREPDKTAIFDEEVLPQQNAAVIQKLAEDEEIVFAGANVPHVQLQTSFSSASSSPFTSSSSSSPNTTNGVPSFMVAYPVASPCSSSEGPEVDPLRDHPETETDSDSSEPTIAVLNPGAEIAADLQRLQDEDPNQRDIISCERIIEPEQFTEDSAESLALASGNRDEVRSDGSDSGLGGEIVGETGNPGPAPESDSETSFLDRIPDEILGEKDKTDAEESEPLGSCEVQRPALSTNPILPAMRSPPKSNLKRRLTDCMEGEPNPKRSNSEESQKKKRNIQFDAVTVYYFPRAQGFTCVPSQGGSTLGMSAAHTHAERFSLTEHAAEQRRIHRARLAQLRSERAANNVVEAASSSEDPSDDTDEEPSDTEELDIDSYYFLLPVPTWQRRALLRAAGVQKIDTVEKDECRDIRASRKHCGCGCKGYCDPESCPCSRAHVKCQVDRAGFPCGCSRDGCANSSGRIEFNPVRVRTHFIHTLMRLELEKKHRDEDCGELRDLDAPPLQSPLRGLPVSGMQDQVADGSCGINGMHGVNGMNGSGFTTLHYPTPQPEIPGTREDSLDLYAIRDDCYPTSEETDPTQQSHHRKLLHPGEFGQPFPFHGPVNNPAGIQQFQQNTYQDYPGYQTLPSTSRGQFHHPQFQQPHHGAPGFPHYGGYGVNEGVMAGCHQTQNVYEANFPEDGAPSQYTNLSSVQPLIVGSTSHHQSIAKLEPFSELLAGRYSYYGEIEPTQSHVAYHQSGPSNGKGDAVEKSIEVQESSGVEEERNGNGQSVNVPGEDCDENFGEIIKKSMVETVSA